MKKIFLIIAFFIAPHISFAYNFISVHSDGNTYYVPPAASQTGISYATTTYPSMQIMQGVAFGTSTVSMVGMNCNQSWCMGVSAYSADGGTTWIGGGMDSGAYQPMAQRVAYGNNIFVAVGSGYYWISTDGGRNYPQKVGAPAYFSDIYFSQGYFYALAGGSTMYRSTDGTTWALFNDIYNTPALGFKSMASNGLLYVGISSTGAVLSSPNGLGSWSTITMPETGTWNSVAYSQGYWVAVSSSGTHRGAYSTNGTTWYWADLTSQSSWQVVAGNMAPPADGVHGVFPAPASYAYNPVPFAGTYYAGTLCYQQIDFNVENSDNFFTVNIAPLSFNSCPLNPLQSYNTSRDMPSTGNYRYRARLHGWNTDLSDSTAWSDWQYFGLGSTTYVPQATSTASWTPQQCQGFTDIGCYVNNAVGGLFYPSASSQNTLTSTLSADNLKYRFPLGYVTDFVTIISTSTESSLVVVDATLPSVLPGGGAHIRIDLSHMLDPVLNATSTIFNNASAPSTQTFYEITSHYWNIILYLAVVFYVIARIVGSHIVPDLSHMNTDTQDLRAKAFSSAEAERYRYKEWQYKNSYQGRGGYGPFKSDKNKLQ